MLYYLDHSMHFSMSFFIILLILGCSSLLLSVISINHTIFSILVKAKPFEPKGNAEEENQTILKITTTQENNNQDKLNDRNT